mmetsp:Transcript_36126/g.93195  ORF Transcript_36126/g.93195 Transcript_36126/m.93195 type:complete len:262 (-) Transcript_36126:454-1239(-)
MAAVLNQGMLRLSLDELLKEQACDMRTPPRAGAAKILEGPPGLHLPRSFRPPPGLSLLPSPRQARVDQQEKVDGVCNDAVLKMSDFCKPAARVTNAEFFEHSSDCSTTDAQDEVVSELRTPPLTPHQTTVAMLACEEMAASEQPPGVAGTGTVLRLGDLLPPAAAPDVPRCRVVPMVGGASCPSVGSAGHHLGLCKPCDFVHRKSCYSGASCKFCHLCGLTENRRHKKENRRRASAPLQAAAALQAGSARLQEMQRAPVLL